MSNDSTEAVVNQLLMLHLIAETTRRYTISGKVKLLKMLFESQRKMIVDKISGFTYHFYKWDYGPYSTEALADLDRLLLRGFLTKGEDGIKVTRKGLEIVNETKELLERHATIMAIFRTVINEFGSRTGRASKVIVYDSPLPDMSKRVRDIDKGETLLPTLDRSSVKEEFYLDEDELETLEIELDNETEASIDRGMDDILHGRVKPYGTTR
jgi:uncharacterized protein YwgA